MKSYRYTLLFCASLLTAIFPATAVDWPQYRGAKGDGISSEKITWPPGGPKKLWSVQTPDGFSSFSVAGDKVFTVVSRTVDGTPRAQCLALDAASGRELWAAPTGVAIYQKGGDSGAPGNDGGDGPRSTPAVGGGRVYVYSAEMLLTCLDANTGKLFWKKDIARELNGRNISWKCAMSPVVDGDRVYLAGGGAGESMLALNGASGDIIWKTGDEVMTHATPVVTVIHGVPQVVFFMQSGLVSVATASGKILWKFPFPYKTSTACSPVVAGDTVFCTAGYDIGGAACQVTMKGGEFSAKELWRSRGNNTAASLWSPPVHKDGYLYGMISFKKFGSGPLKCIDLKTGDLKWEQPGFGAGNVVLAGNSLVALADNGELVLVEASPKAYREFGRSKAVEGKCWSTPALRDGKLYIRSTKEGACFDLSAAN